MIDKTQEELRACKTCGADCSVQTFSGPAVEATIWMCSNHLKLGSACPDVNVYLSAEAWNIRPDNTPEILNDIAVMMSEFVENWPQPKKIGTALALIAKAMRAALDPPKHNFWGAGEADCPRDIKATNGELHTLRCKVCGKDNPRDNRCLNATPEPQPAGLEERAREILAIEFEAAGRPGSADRIRNASYATAPDEQIYLAAIRKALSSSVVAMDPADDQ